MASGVYVIENLLNGHRYIGSAVDLDGRHVTHLSALRCGRHHSRHLQHAWDKYGEAAFTFEVLEDWELEFLTSMEQWWMNMLKPEYNIAPNARSPLGVRHTAKTRAKHSLKMLGNTHVRGHVLSDSHKRKLSEATKGRPKSEETRARMSAALKVRMSRPEERARASTRMKGNKLGVGREVSLEERAGLSARSMGNKYGLNPRASTRAKISASAKGRKHMPEELSKMSAAMKLSWAERRKLETPNA